MELEAMQEFSTLHMEIYYNISNDSYFGVGERDLELVGPQTQAFLITLYSLTALLALGGNVTVVVVLIAGKRSSRELRIFLINLALSDITMALFSIPFTYTGFVLGQWIFDPNFCPFVQFMQHCSVIVSVYTLTVIGIDRFYAIMYPLNTRWTKSQGTLIVLCIWLVGIAFSSVQVIHGKAQKFNWGGKELYECIEKWNEVSGKVYTLAVFIVTFVFPMIILTFTYTVVGLKMWKHTSPGNADPTRDHQQLQAKIKVVKMLAIVVILFAACWLPIHILNLLLYFLQDELTPDTDNGYYGYIAAFFICHWLSMANSFMNPIIYCFMSDNFRADLKQLAYYSRPKYGTRADSRCQTPGLQSTRTSSFHSASMIAVGNNSSIKENNYRLPETSLSQNPNCQPLLHCRAEEK